MGSAEAHQYPLYVNSRRFIAVLLSTALLVTSMPSSWAMGVPVHAVTDMSFSQTQALVPAVLAGYPSRSYQPVASLRFVSQAAALAVGVGSLAGLAWSGQWKEFLSAFSFLGLAGIAWISHYDPKKPELSPKDQEFLLRRLRRHLQVLDLLSSMDQQNKPLDWVYRIDSVSHRSVAVRIESGDLSRAVIGMQLLIPGTVFRFHLNNRVDNLLILEREHVFHADERIPARGQLLSHAPDAIIKLQREALKRLVETLETDHLLKRVGKPTTTHRLLGWLRQQPFDPNRIIPKKDFVNQKIPYREIDEGAAGDSAQEEVVQRVFNGTTRIHFVPGVAGGGKSTLIHELADQGMQRGWPVAVVCPQNQPLDSLLRGLVAPDSRSGRVHAPAVPVLRLANVSTNIHYGMEAYWPGRPRIENKQVLSYSDHDDAVRDFVRKREHLQKVYQRPAGYAVFSTPMGLVNNQFWHFWKSKEAPGSKRFKLIVIDESSRITLPELLTVLEFLEDDGHLVLFGDLAQLTTFGFTDEERQFLTHARRSDGTSVLDLKTIDEYTQSAFEWLMARGDGDKVQLIKNYRSRRLLVEFFSLMYEHPLLANDQSEQDPDTLVEIDLSSDLHANGSLYETSDRDGQIVNHRSARETLRTVKWLLNDKKLKPSDITIITPYKAQIQLYEALLERELGDAGKSILIATVDGYQGGQNRAVIFDAVRSNAENDIGFMTDLRRLTVALTRAEEFMVVIWNRKTFTDEPLRSMKKARAEEDRVAREKYREIGAFLSGHASRRFTPVQKPVLVSPVPPPALPTKESVVSVEELQQQLDTAHRLTWQSNLRAGKWDPELLAMMSPSLRAECAPFVPDLLQKHIDRLIKEADGDKDLLGLAQEEALELIDKVSRDFQMDQLEFPHQRLTAFVRGLVEQHLPADAPSPGPLPPVSVAVEKPSPSEGERVEPVMSAPLWPSASRPPVLWELKELMSISVANTEWLQMNPAYENRALISTLWDILNADASKTQKRAWLRQALRNGLKGQPTEKDLLSLLSSPFEPDWEKEIVALMRMFLVSEEMRFMDELNVRTVWVRERLWETLNKRVYAPQDKGVAVFVIPIPTYVASMPFSLLAKYPVIRLLSFDVDALREVFQDNLNSLPAEEAGIIRQRILNKQIVFESLKLEHVFPADLLSALQTVWRTSARDDIELNLLEAIGGFLTRILNHDWRSPLAVSSEKVTLMTWVSSFPEMYAVLLMALERTLLKHWAKSGQAKPGDILPDSTETMHLARFADADPQQARDVTHRMSPVMLAWSRLMVILTQRTVLDSIPMLTPKGRLFVQIWMGKPTNSAPMDVEGQQALLEQQAKNMSLDYNLPINVWAHPMVSTGAWLSMHPLMFLNTVYMHFHNTEASFFTLFGFSKHAPAMKSHSPTGLQVRQAA